jgi:hypothetical protein
MATTIRVDLNNATVRGLIRASLKRADGPVAVGDTVTVVDMSDADDCLEATVMDLENGRATLQLSERHRGFAVPADAWRALLFKHNFAVAEPAKPGFAAAGLVTTRSRA